MRWQAMVLACVTGMALLAGSPGGAEPSALSRLRAARTWVSYYGSDQIASLLRYDVVDIDAEDGAGNYTAADIARMKATGKMVLSYLNVGSAEPFRSYYGRVRQYAIAPYPGWPESYMDVSRPGYREVLLGIAVPELLRKGVDGLFLDNVDAGFDLHRPDITTGIVELVRQIRLAHPGILLVAQSHDLRILGERGADGRAFYQYVDGLAREEVSTTYQGGYHRVPTAQSDAALRALAQWKARGLVVFTLDYADSADLAHYAMARSRASGLIPYVGPKNLDRIPSW